MKRTPLKRTGFIKKSTWKRLQPISKMKHRRIARFVPVATGKRVKERSGGICEFFDQFGRRCCEVGTCFQHRKKKSQGGKHTLENLRHSCWFHNLWAETEEGKKLSPKIGWTIL